MTGELVRSYSASDLSLPHKYFAQRVRRTRLQSALLAEVPKDIIQLKKRLVSLEDLDSGGVYLVFEDGTAATADLVVGGDGIRSVVREHTFPGHAIKFIGTTIWRVLIPLSSISHIPDISSSTAWWHGPSGHVYFSRVDDPSENAAGEHMFEIACRNVIDPSTSTEKRFSWGIPATNEKVESHFKDYDPRVRKALAQVPEGLWKEFSAFAGPRLETVTAWDKVALIGDASHPLSGAFGSGAAFALEDAWILAQSLSYARSNDKPVSDGLRIFDSIRSPYYRRMYEHLDQQKKAMVEAKTSSADRSFQEVLNAKVGSFGGENLKWVYGNNIEEVWREYLESVGGE